MNEVRVIGMPEALAELDPARVAGELAPGFEALATEVDAAARGIIAGHRLTGAAQASIVASASGGSIGSLAARVVSHDPAVGALSFGWSGHGHQPPLEPIARWLELRGKDPAGAFAVARAIGERGLSFDPLETFRRAWQIVEPRAAAIVERFVR